LALSVDSGGVANLIQQVSKQIVSGIDKVICFRWVREIPGTPNMLHNCPKRKIFFREMEYKICST